MKKKIKKRIVIFGGSGFIGSNLLSFYVDNRKYDLLSISRSKFSMKGVKSLQGNFSDKEFLRKIINKGDIIVHLACTTVPATSEENRDKDYIQNVLGTEKMLEVCVEKEINKFIFMSSGGTVYGDHGNKKVSEKSDVKPISYHGKMKLRIEGIVQDFNKNHKLDFLIIRVSNPFGRSSVQQKNNQGVIEVFLNKAIKGEQVELLGNGEQVRDFIYIKDLILALNLLIESEIKNEIINIGSGQGHSINEVVRAIESNLDKKIKIKYKSSRNFDVPYNVLDTSKLCKLVNWKMKYSFEEGVKKIVKQYSL